MKLNAVATLLEDQGIARPGRDLFIGAMPAKVTKGILLRQPFGGTPINHELPGYRKTSFMLVVRGPDYPTAETLINQAIDALTIGENFEIEGVRFNYMRPRDEPFPYPLSDGGAFEFLVNIDACYTLSE